MTNAWTPGPWKECKDGKCTCGLVWSIPGDFPVCTVQIPRVPIAVAHEHMADSPDDIYQSIKPEMCAANARLIAAAPDMAEALSNLLPADELGGIYAKHDLIAAARAALRKARGEAP